MNMQDLQDELTNYLDTLIITSENIGEIRRSCFMPFDSSWNMFVREATAARENKPIKDLTIEEKYYELLYAVGNYYKGETRHQTALRYILNAEKSDVETYGDVRKDIRCRENGNFNEPRNCQKSQPPKCPDCGSPKRDIPPLQSLTPNKNVKVPKYDIVTEGYDPDKLTSDYEKIF